MTPGPLTAAQNQQIDELVRCYLLEDNQAKYKVFLDSINLWVSGSKALNKLAHSFRYRLKDPEHLRDKLQRKMRNSLLANGEPFDITTDNLFLKVNDLAGYRILHLYTRQFADIDQALAKAFEEPQFKILEGPEARIWDEDSRQYFESINVKTVVHPRMYSSVHYVITSNSLTPLTCEIQVRTLAQEVWGEVDHKINYPHQTEFLSCREQIKALAWSANGYNRLVDSIFATLDDATKKKTS